jgi:hypothetical protein
MPKAWKNLCGGVNFPKNFAISQKRPPCFVHAQPHHNDDKGFLEYKKGKDRAMTWVSG